MTNAEASSRVDLLILARLATAGPRPPSPRKLEQDLSRFVEARLSTPQWSIECAARLSALRERGDIDERRVPTAAGLQRLREGLGVDALPSKWQAVWQALVPALVLDLPGKAWPQLTSAGKLRARLIRQHHGLELPGTPTLAQAVDAQAWQELEADTKGSLGATKVKLALMQQALGIPVRSVAEAVNAWCWTLLGQPPKTDFSMGTLRRVLLQRTLDTPLRPAPLTAAKAGEWLAATAAGTARGDIESIRRALVARWIFGDGAKALEPAAETTSAEPLSPSEWASTVQQLAGACEDGRVGDERVFIASVWRAAAADPRLSTGSLDAFKAQLVEANRAGRLRLHRADLANHLDPELVRASETRYLTATFHFIEIEIESGRRS